MQRAEEVHGETQAAGGKSKQLGDWKNVRVEVEDGIAWVTMNRPEKRNAMSPALNDEMVAALDAVEVDKEAGVLVLTGSGDSFSAGMDLREFFRAIDHLSYEEQVHIRRSAWHWQWRMLQNYMKPTIAMVNGWCFGGAFTPLVACDLAIAADDAQFGLSEINWGIIPGGNVTRAVVATMRHRDAMMYVMTGRTFDGKKAAEMGLVNESVPARELARAHQGARDRAAGQESDGAARGQAGGALCPGHVMGDVGRVSDGQEPSGALPRCRRRPQQGPEAVPRREELPARPRRL